MQLIELQYNGKPIVKDDLVSINVVVAYESLTAYFRTNYNFQNSTNRHSITIANNSVTMTCHLYIVRSIIGALFGILVRNHAIYSNTLACSCCVNAILSSI